MSRCWGYVRRQVGADTEEFQVAPIGKGAVAFSTGRFLQDALVDEGLNGLGRGRH